MADKQGVKVKYTGRHKGGVDLTLPNGRALHAPHGEAIEVPAGDYAAGLLMQEGNWQPVGAAAKEAAAEVKEAQAEAAPQKGG